MFFPRLLHSVLQFLVVRRTPSMLSPLHAFSGASCWISKTGLAGSGFVCARIIGHEGEPGRLATCLEEFLRIPVLSFFGLHHRPEYHLVLFAHFVSSALGQTVHTHLCSSPVSSSLLSFPVSGSLTYERGAGSPLLIRSPVLLAPMPAIFRRTVPAPVLVSNSSRFIDIGFQ